MQVFQGRTTENHASGDLTDVQGRTKRIAGSRLAGGHASEKRWRALSILRKHGAWEHLLMEDAPERGSLAS